MKSIVTESDYRTISKIERKPIYTDGNPNGLVDYKTHLTEFAFEKVKSQIQLMGNVQFVGESDGLAISKKFDHYTQKVVIYMTKDDRCNCPFFKIMLLSCKHMLAFLQSKTGCIFGLNGCNRKWLKCRIPIIFDHINYKTAVNDLMQT